MAAPKKNRMVAFKMLEISAVDRPAQEGARAVIMKRDDATVEKRCALTTAVHGHSHLFYLDHSYNEGNPQVGGSTGYDYGHSHPWVMGADGKITIGEAQGHTHDVAEISAFTYEAHGLMVAKRDEINKSGAAGTQESNPMTDAEKAAAAQAEQTATLAKAQGELAVAKAYGELTDVQKAHYNTLDEAGKTSYLAKSATERQAVVDDIAKAAGDKDPVVYKSADGTEFRKSDDPRLVELAKGRDEDRKELAKSRAANEQAGFEKRAQDTLPNLPGTVQVRAAIVKALDGISDEVIRKAAFESIQAGDKVLSKAFQNLGHGGAPVIAKGDTDKAAAEDELDQLAKAHVVANPTVDYFTAYEIVSKANPEVLKRAV